MKGIALVVILACVQSSHGFVKMVPYVSLNVNSYNVSSCGEESSRVITYEADCLDIYEKRSNSIPKCCYSLLNSITNNTDFRICYPEGVNSSRLYDCTSNYDFFEKRIYLYAFGIIGIMALCVLGFIILYCLCAWMRLGFFRSHRYAPV